MPSSVGNSSSVIIRMLFARRCTHTILFALITLDFTYASVIRRVRPGCELMTNEDWSNTQALLLNKEMTKIIHPDYNDSVLLTSTEEVVLACPGSQLSMKPQSETVASCRRGTELEIDDEEYEFSSMSCEKLPVTSTRVVGKCVEETADGVNVEIGFDVDTNFIKLLDVCFDNKTLSAIYSHYVASPKIIGRQHGVKRPQFKADGFYPGLNIAKLYTINTQQKTLSDILGSDELGKKYIKNDKLHYLARGHLTAKADFIYGAEQLGTFYYINVAPQWQIINGGNWAELENSVRSYVTETGEEISVYTAPYEVAVLPDINENLQKLYIYHETYDDEYLVPVPKFYIKILYHEYTKTGVAFVTVNNPYLEEITDDYILCDDICEKYPWLTWDQLNIEQGYSYCCPYHSLQETVKTLPDLPIEDLLR